MKHGLMIGGFGANAGLRKVYKKEWTVSSRNLDNSPDYYRSFGNHRIATFLRKKGWDVECLDYAFYMSDEELRQFLDDRITAQTKFLGMSLLFPLAYVARNRLQALIDWMKRSHPHVTLVVGGVKAFVLTEIGNVDYYVAGSGEYALEAILEAEHFGGPSIKHTIWKQGMLVNAYRDYPAHPKPDASIHYEERDYIQPHETLNVEFARGCIFKCTYCTFPLIGMKGSMDRCADSLYRELKENYEKWGVRNYYITDDTVNDRADKMEMVANVVKKLDFQPQFSGYARADLCITHGEKTWDDMIQAGFTSHSYGVETLNHASGKAVGKGMKPEKMKEGLLKIEEYFNKNMSELQYYAGSLTMIAGLPHESYASLDRTKEWLNEYWTNHAVAYLPLRINSPEEVMRHKEAENADGNIADNFYKQGYTFEYKKPDFIEDERVRNVIEGLVQAKDYMKGTRGKVPWNFWVHPSKEYDYVDMLQWTYEWMDERIEMGATATYCFESNIPTAQHKDYPRNVKHHFKRHPLRSDPKNQNLLIMEYINKKLGLNIGDKETTNQDLGGDIYPLTQKKKLRFQL